MRCSSCTAIVKPVVAIDIDGTLGDYHGWFLNFAMQYLGKTAGPGKLYDGRGPFRQWFCEVFDVDERTWHDIKLAYRQGGMKRSMPMWPYADRLCQDVRMAGAELWLTTTRPYLRLDNVDPDTRAWLARHQIEYDAMLYDEDKYRHLAQLVDRERVVAVLDDLIEMYEQAAEAFHWRVPMLRRTLWNRAIATDGAAYNLPDAIDEILARITQWKEQHA